MNTTTQPIWDDPVAHLIGTAGATVATGCLIMQYVTVPYFYAITAQWRRVSEPIIMTAFESPEAFTELLFTLPTSSLAIIPFVSGWALMAVLAIIPMSAIAGLPFAVSYLFWMKIVYARVLSAGDTA